IIERLREACKGPFVVRPFDLHKAGSYGGASPLFRQIAAGPKTWPNKTSRAPGGLSKNSSARPLYISPHTLNNPHPAVFAKLGVPNRVALAAVVHHSIE